MANGDKKPNDATLQVRLPEAMKAAWTERAKETASSRAEFVRQMVEAGYKKFDAVPERDATNAELHEQRRELRDEIDEKNKRIRKLENRVASGERAHIRRFIAENGPAEWDEIVDEVTATAPERTRDRLNELEADGGLETRKTPDGTTLYRLSDWEKLTDDDGVTRWVSPEYDNEN